MDGVVASLASTLRYQCGRLARAVRRTIRNPGEPEVHRLRVVTRRLRAIVRLARELPRAAPAVRAGKRLRRLGRTLGERRMWDVAMEGMVGIHEHPERFAPRRDKATKSLTRELERLELERLLEDLRATGRLLRGLPPELLAARARQLRLSLSRARARPVKKAEARHGMRIRVKKARYLLEACGIAAPGARRLQTLLGDEHDLAVLRELVGANAEQQRREVDARKRSDRACAPALEATIGLLRALERALAPGNRPDRRTA